MIENRPDFSNYLAHFTRGDAPVGSKDAHNPANAFASMSAGERLGSILEKGIIMASTMPWTNRRASLLLNARGQACSTTPTVIPLLRSGFQSPMYLLPAEARCTTCARTTTRNRIGQTTFTPSSHPSGRNTVQQKLKDKKFLGGATVDYSHEREWRLPHDFSFKLEQVEFVILPTYEEMAKFPQKFKDAIGRDKFLLMEVYKTTERLWPVHNIG